MLILWLFRAVSQLNNEELKDKEKFDFVVDDTAQPSFADPLADLDETAQPDRLIGTVLAGKLQIESVLGTGGMSTVYRAKHLLLDRIVAVKLVHGGHVQGKAIQRFQQEAKAATRLNHPNIATVREFGQDDQGCPYLVMDFVEGISLADELKQNGAMSAERTEKLISAACAGLKHAHDNGVIHRDLKPGNIILSLGPDGQETAKLVDFGIAKLLDEENKANLTQTGEVFGTPNYMSPEQCLGKHADLRTDIYSMGCVTFECLSGKPPFECESALETLMSHVNEPADFTKLNCPPNVKAAVQRCIEKKPEDRWQSIDEFQNCLQDRSIKEFKTKPKKTSKKKLIAICVAATICSALAGVAVAIAPYVPQFWDAYFPPPWEAMARDAAREISKGPGSYNSARVLVRRALKTAKENNVSDAGMESLYGQFGKISVAMFEYSEAEKYFNSALELSAKHKEDFNRGSYHEWLCTTNMEQRRYLQAVEHGRQAVDIKYRVLGKFHKLTLTSMLKYGQALRYNGQVKEALKMNEDAFEVAKKLYPQNDNIAVANAQLQLANTQADLGKTKKATFNYVASVKLSNELLGPENEQTIRNRKAVVEFLTHEKRTKELEALLKDLDNN